MSESGDLTVGHRDSSIAHLDASQTWWWTGYAWVPAYTPDLAYWWNGYFWKPTLSPDGRMWWNGRGWVLIELVFGLPEPARPVELEEEQEPVSQKMRRSSLRSLITGFVVLGMFILLSTLVTLRGGSSEDNDDVLDLLSDWKVYAVQAAVVTVIMAVTITWRTTGLFAVPKLRGLTPAAYVVLAISFMAIFTFVVTLAISATTVGGALVPIIACTFFIGFSEELFVRGWIYGGLMYRLKPWVLILVTGCIFGLLHLTNLSVLESGMSVLLQVVFASVSGMFFAILRYVTGSIWIPILQHWMLDAAIGAAMSTEPPHYVAVLPVLAVLAVDIATIVFLCLTKYLKPRRVRPLIEFQPAVRTMIKYN